MAKKFKMKRKASQSGLVRTAASGIFLPDYPVQVKAIAMRGLTDDDIAEQFGVDKDLFALWKKHYPSFRDAIEKGRTHADAEVVHALWKRATGKFTVPHTEIIKYKNDFETFQMEKHFPPDVEAAKWWLKNRQREYWNAEQSQTHTVQGPGKNGQPVKIESRQELIAGILQLITPKPDGESLPPGMVKPK